MVTFTASQFRIPAMPQIAREALAYFYKSDPDIGLISRIILSDVSLTGTILKLGNSARFNTSGPKTSDVKVAIGRIGLNALRQILVTHAFSESFRVDASCPLDCTAFWRHSAMTAEIAYDLAFKWQKSAAADLQLAGVMHDIGFLLLAMCAPDKCAKIIQNSQQTGNDYATAEVNLGLDSHHTLSAAVVHEWNIPQTVETLVSLHDVTDPKILSQLPEEMQIMVGILQLSDSLAHRFGGGYRNYRRDSHIDPKVLSTAGLSSDDVSRAVKNAKSFLEVFLPT